MRRFAPQLFAQRFCITVFVFAASNSQGQIPNRPTTQEQIQNREWSLGNLRENLLITTDSVGQPFDRIRLQALLNLRNDFRNLQIVNNELMSRVFEHSSITNQKITQREIRSRLGEIKKLAERLRFNLGIPKLKASEPLKDVALQPGLLQLDKAIMSFVENPFFQQTRVYNSELMSRAERDMDEVLKLTDALRKLTREN